MIWAAISFELRLAQNLLGGEHHDCRNRVRFAELTPKLLNLGRLGGGREVVRLLVRGDLIDPAEVRSPERCAYDPYDDQE